MDHYILKNGKIMPATVFEYIDWDKDDVRRIDRTQITDDVSVSTVFLGLDHNWGRSPHPVLFETMIFGGPYAYHQWRYHTLGDAKQGHYQVVECLRSGKEPENDAAI